MDVQIGKKSIFTLVTIHDGSKDYTCCSYCKSFGFLQTLKNHVDTVHECVECNKSFTTRAILKKRPHSSWWQQKVQLWTHRKYLFDYLYIIPNLFNVKSINLFTCSCCLSMSIRRGWMMKRGWSLAVLTLKQHFLQRKAPSSSRSHSSLLVSRSFSFLLAILEKIIRRR